MPVFSNARFSTFEQYLLKYKYQYIDRIKVEMLADTVEMFMGSCVHEALEKLYKDLKLQNNRLATHLYSDSNPVYIFPDIKIRRFMDDHRGSVKE